MALNGNLWNSILSMDAYNRGYGAGIDGLGDLGSKIGNYTIITDSRVLKDANDQRQDEPAGFYAVAYDSNNDGVADIISYRGTDYPDDGSIIPKDVKYGWTLGGGDTDSPQGLMAIQFYKDIANLAALPG